MEPVLAITLGDPAGIGPEITAKMLAGGGWRGSCRTLIVADARLFRLGERTAGVSCGARVVKSEADIVWENSPVLLDTADFNPEGQSFGELSPAAGKYTGDSLLRAVDLLVSGTASGMLFGPMNKASLQLGGYDFRDKRYPGSHGIIAKHLNWTGPFGEINVMRETWTTRVTSHIPHSEVARSLTAEKIRKAIDLADATMRRFLMKNPRIAVAALNPHCGENGACGREEIDIIAPAVEQAQKDGLNIVGPLSADTLFALAILKKKFDAIITMYHDQGQIALKLAAGDQCVTISGGLPYPIVTPAHGTAFDIAGKGLADESATVTALGLLAKMAKTWNTP